MQNLIKILYSEDSYGVKTVLNWEFHPLKTIPANKEKDLLAMGRRAYHNKSSLKLSAVEEEKIINVRYVNEEEVEIEPASEGKDAKFETQKVEKFVEETVKEIVRYTTESGDEIKVFYATDTFEDQLLGEGIESITLDDSDQGYSYTLNSSGDAESLSLQSIETYKIYRELAILNSTKAALDIAKLDTTYVTSLISDLESEL